MTESAPKPAFSEDVMERLFYWARDRVASVVAHTECPDRNALGEEGARAVLGAFVSFKKRGRLRSCMGYMNEGSRLDEALDSASVSAALHDPRFPPIDASEFYDLDLEVWALGAFRRIEEKGEARRDAFLIGRDGLQIQGRGRRGLLLPSVPVELGWNVDQFLDGLCDKAGLARGSWRDDGVELYAFEGVSFKKPFVWNISRNPELARIVESARLGNRSSESARPSFSFSPELFSWSFSSPKSTPSVPRDLSKETRPAAVAGMFYPGTTKERDEFFELFENGVETNDRTPALAALVPHAGWIYSGRLAYQTLSRIAAPETIVVVAPKHRREGANLAVMPYGAWSFGDGETVESDVEFVDELTRAIPSFKKDAVAHRAEHSIEVETPILARLFPNAKIVGILIGAATQSELDALAKEFAEFLASREASGRPRPLLVISSDMNHYASDARTREIDKMATDAMETLDPSTLLETVLGNRITMCGILPAYFVLSTLKDRGELTSATRVGYATSGDIRGGDKERVVGYAGYVFN